MSHTASDIRPADGDRYDVIVVGAGAAGLTAAATAAVSGCRVLVVEATARVGGTTAVSGGMVWIPANYKMKEGGLADSEAAAREYLRHTVPGSEHDPRMSAFLARGDEAVRFLEQHTAVKLRPVRRYPDYYPDLPGATAGGRVLEPLPFDGRSLGRDFTLLRDPLPELTLFGGMMISREDIPVLRRVGRSPMAAWHTAKLVDPIREAAPAPSSRHEPRARERARGAALQVRPRPRCADHARGIGRGTRDDRRPRRRRAR